MLNFIGIGAQKSGTTWLYSTLKKHCRIAFPAGKEVHFWDQFYDRGFEWYERAFHDEQYFNGDITPAYGHLPAERISEIYSRMPYLRLIYLIRNPIDRAWSSAKMDLIREGMSIEETPDQWFIDHFQSDGSIARGDYEANIRRWHSFFPAGQLLIIRYEAICNNPIAAANMCLNHIGIDDLFTDKDRERLMQRVFEGSSALLRPSLHPTLMEIYQNRIISLGNYLNEDITSWLGMLNG